MPNSINNQWFIPAELFYSMTSDESEESEELPDFSENLPADLKDFRKKVQLIQMDDGMCVTVIAINNKNYEMNEVRTIPAYTGEAINVGVYDLVKDSYIVECQSYRELGPIPINYKLCIKGAYGWMVDVPLPLSIIERYLTQDQKDDLAEWVSNLGNVKDFTLETIQVVNVY